MDYITEDYTLMVVYCQGVLNAPDITWIRTRASSFYQPISRRATVDDSLDDNEIVFPINFV
jgi:hypothetical protein